MLKSYYSTEKYYNIYHIFETIKHVTMSCFEKKYIKILQSNQWINHISIYLTGSAQHL